MDKLPPALQPLADYDQFIIYKIVPRKGNKTDKQPIDHNTLELMPKDVDWQNNSHYWTTAEDAIRLASKLGARYGVGYLLTKNDPYTCIDLDDCLKNGVWSSTAITLTGMLPNAAVEVSYSGTGLHIFCTGTTPEHKCKNTELKIEMYTERRFMALTGTHARGDANADYSDVLVSIVSTYFPPTVATRNATWTTEPLPAWTNPGTDEDLLTKALLSSSTAGKFATVATFRDLWECNTDVLIEMYPPLTNNHPWDQSSCDAALAQHLAFWTGCNCDHIWNLMWKSALQRDKWRWHKTYLQMTITRAVSLCKMVYTGGGNKERVITAFDVPKLKGTDRQIQWAESIREAKLVECNGDKGLLESLSIDHGPAVNASFWIDRKDLLPGQLAPLVQPVTDVVTINTEMGKPLRRDGYQYMPIDKQIEYFADCIYVQDIHRIYTPNGVFLKSEQFNVTYGGYSFQLSTERETKPTKKAYEAFTESQGVKYAMAESTSFRPDLTPGGLFDDEGTIYLNSYKPVITEQIEGDIEPFLTHLFKLLPDEGDQAVLLAYMAACIQHKGHKFQWAPLIQGVQGNGKTLFTRCVAFAIGKKYTHMPFASEISEKFNEWLFENIFIGVEDVHIADNKQEIIEILKPIISNDRLTQRAMQTSQVTQSSCANFMLNMNQKGSFKIDPNERRYAPFFTAQQAKSDLFKDGLTVKYFTRLYTWLRQEGYPIINHYLSNYDIPQELNPAVTAGGGAAIAPYTTSTPEALRQSMGGIEQEIIEAVEQGRKGFAGGWISSTWLDDLLNGMGAQRRITHLKRDEILASLGYRRHPGLDGGRVNNPIKMDGNRSRLYLKNDHDNIQCTNHAEIIKAYESKQPVIINPFTET